MYYNICVRNDYLNNCHGKRERNGASAHVSRDAEKHLLGTERLLIRSVACDLFINENIIE